MSSRVAAASKLAAPNYRRARRKANSSLHGRRSLASSPTKCDPILRKWRVSPLKLDAPAAARRRSAHSAFRHHDARRGFTTHLARFLDGLFDGDLHGVGKFIAGIFERRGLEFEGQRQHTGRRK